MAYRLHRLLISAPPELDAERSAAESVITEFNEEVAMHSGDLFAFASFRAGVRAARMRPFVEENVRQCPFVLLIFGEQAPEEISGHFLDYAIQQVHSTESETARIGVLFRVAGEVTAEARAYRESTGSRGECEVREFRSEAELRAAVTEMLTRWYGPLRSAATQ